MSNLWEDIRFLYRAWRYQWKVESAEIRHVKQRVQPGQTVVDIGGHKGAFTYWLRRRVGPMGRVLVFEPQPELADYLRRRVARFGYSNVTVIEAALSDASGEATLYRARNETSPGATLEERSATAGNAFQVTVDTLDRALARHGIDQVDFIKCDAEGHELNIFRGATKTLATGSPELLFECEQRHLGQRSIQEVFDYLSQQDFEGRFFHDGQLKTMPTDSTDVPDGVYNFVYGRSQASQNANQTGHPQAA